MRMTLNMVFGSVSFGLSAVCGTCLPGGCAVATHSQGDWTESAERDPSLPGARSPHLAEARSRFWKGERASVERADFKQPVPVCELRASRETSSPSTMPAGPM